MPLRSLRVLKLDGNDIHTFPHDFFSHTTQLEVLDLHGNSIEYLDTNTRAALGVLLNLKVTGGRFNRFGTSCTVALSGDDLS